MSDFQCEVRADDCSPWEVLSAELLGYNVRVGTSIVKYWRSIAEIQVATLVAIAGTRATPAGRRSKFTIIQGGINN